MKKFTIVICILIMITCLCGCGNMSMGLGNFTFEHIHIDTYHHSGCYTIEKWYENGSGIEVLTEEIGSIFCSEGTYTLISDSDKCPFCNKEG